MVLKFLVVLLLLLVPLSFFFFHQKSSLKVKPIAVQSQNLLTSANTKPQFEPTTPSLEQIFTEDHTWVATLTAEKIRTLLATGDVIPARVVNIQETKFNNYRWPYEKTFDVLRSADITFINLETPLIKDCPLINDGFKFCGSDKNIEGLIFAGVDVVSLANNHAGNYGLEAINETVSLLINNSILVTGANGPIYKDLKGLKFAFLGYNDIGYKEDGISWADEEKIRAEIIEAKKNASVVIVTYHWGAEYRSQPDARQKYLGHFTIDVGADLVIGNHPHWIQPVEIYKGKLITYAHGNFVFDQEWSLKTKQGVVGRYTFYDNQLIDVEFLPIQIENYGQPYFLTGNGKQKILDEMKNESSILASDIMP